MPIIKISKGRICVPVWCILIYYPLYILVLESIVFRQRSDIMIDQIVPTMENLVLVIVAVMATVISALTIHFLLQNEYADTRKRKLNEQLEALQSGAEANPLVLEYYSSYDKTFTKVMIPSIIVASVMSVGTIIGMTTFYSQVALIYVAPFVTVPVALVWGLLFEKVCQSVAGGDATEKYGDKVLATIGGFLKDALPTVDEAEQKALAEMERMKSEYEAKFGKKL